MKETYLNNLSKALDSVNAKNKDEILKKYEKRYDFGLESGLTEEEIEQKLGDPSVIAKEYQNNDKSEKEFDFKNNYNLIVHTINDNVRVKKSIDNKIHIKFDFDDYDNYNITDNGSGVRVEYQKTKFFALNRKKPGEILIELPSDVVFDLSEITSSSGDIYVDYIKCNRAIFSSTSGILKITDLDTKTVSLTTVSADIMIDKISGDRVSISTVSGKIDADKIDSTSLIVDTISGDINVNNTDSRLKISSITGNITVNGKEYNSLKEYVKGVFRK